MNLRVMNCQDYRSDSTFVHHVTNLKMIVFSKAHNKANVVVAFVEEYAIQEKEYEDL